MDKCSYFIRDIAMFGSYPCQNTINLLEKKGFKYFVNLTFPTESKIKHYNTIYNKIQYPFMDNSIPEDIYSFCIFIILLTKLISNLEDDQKIYLHCKGGHGRSGVVVSCICFMLFPFSSKQSLIYTNICHSKRITMRKKWRKIGSPQTFTQKNFVNSICKFIEVPKQLLIDSNYSVKFNDKIYKNALEAFIQNKNEYTCQYILLDEILLLRVKQHLILKDILINTFLSKFVCYNITNYYDVIFMRCINNLKFNCL